VAAEAAKPESVYTVEKIEATVQTIAHLSQPVPRSYLADAPLLARYLDTVLREGLQLALEEQVIAGDGTAPDLEGILETSGILTQAYSTDVLTTCRKALTALELYSIIPDGWVFHPSDWETLELLTSANHYLMGQGQGQALPVDRARRRLWGVPVALSLGMTEGQAILADFAGSTQLWEREQTRVDWSENVYDSVSGTTDFERNLIRYRCEGRWGFAVTRPHGVCVVDLVSGS
jgi:HK97 family phage major capsid protein